MAEEKHEQLPELIEDYFPGRVVVKKEETPEEKNPFSQWRILKLIQEEESQSLTKADICKLLGLESRDDTRIDGAIGQLIRGGKIVQSIGHSRHTKGIGNVYSISPTVPEKSARVESPRTRTKDTSSGTGT